MFHRKSFALILCLSLSFYCHMYHSHHSFHQARIALLAEVRSADNGGRRLGDALAGRIVRCVYEAHDGEEQLM